MEAGATQPVERSANCFGCSQTHRHGLRMTFAAIGDESIVSEVCIGMDYESYPGVVHGGIVATLLDEAMARVVLDKTSLPVVTTGLRLRYGQVMRPNEHYRVIATLLDRTVNTISASAEVRDWQDQIVAVGNGTFLSLSSERIEALEQKLPARMVADIQAGQALLPGEQT